MHFSYFWQKLQLLCLMLTKKKIVHLTKKIVFFSMTSEFAQNWCTESLKHPDHEYQLRFRMRLLKRN